MTFIEVSLLKVTKLIKDRIQDLNIGLIDFYTSCSRHYDKNYTCTWVTVLYLFNTLTPKSSHG